MHTIYVGLTGPAGSGKTTVAFALFKLLFGKMRGPLLASFATPLKAIAEDVVKHLASDVYWTAVAEDGDISKTTELGHPFPPGYTYRHLLQHLGTEFGRKIISDSIWVDTLFASYEGAAEIVIIDDVRFNNEASAIWDRGGVVFRLPARSGGADVLPGDSAKHISETGLTYPISSVPAGTPEEMAAWLYQHIEHLIVPKEGLTP